MPSLVASYVHDEGRVGVLVELRFRESTSARTSEFNMLAHEIAMQVAAMDPVVVNPSQLNATEWSHRLAQLSSSPSLASLAPGERIAALETGRLQYERQFCLLKQPFIKDDTVLVEDRIAEVAAQLSERIEVVRFCRYAADAA